MVTSAVAHGQRPWTVTVTAGESLAVGACGAVSLIATDTVTGDRARGPNGAYLSPGDFDITVTAADSMAVASHRIDRDHTVACACQGAKRGTVGTVKASYPARSLARAASAPGVKLASTTTFKVQGRVGGSNPPECVAAAARVAARKAAARKAAAAKKAAAKQ